MRIDIPELLDTLSPFFTLKSFKKGELITQEGEVQHEIYWVDEGIQMSYFNNDGKQHIIAFTYPPSLCGIPDSFFYQRPSKYTLEALTDTRLRAISYQTLQDLFVSKPQLERTFRIIAEDILAGFIDRYIELHAFSIEQRFRSFAARSPHLLQRIPHRHIANYLHIDPTNFSKLYNSIKI